MISNEECEQNNTPMVTVCDGCLRASCWHGEFMCDEAKGCGTVEKSIKELALLSLEHKSYWDNPDRWKAKNPSTKNKITLRYKADGLIEPADNKLMFCHCSNGYIAVNKQMLDEDVTPILENHGFLVVIENEPPETPKDVFRVQNSNQEPS